LLLIYRKKNEKSVKVNWGEDKKRDKKEREREHNSLSLLNIND